MKLTIAGSTGFVGTEVVRQALSNPAITSILGLARRVTAVPESLGPGSDISKLKSVVCEDFENYPESIKQELAGTDACIWLIAVTISKATKTPLEESRKICLDYTMTGLETMSQLRRDSMDSSSSKPFRFLYTSGAKAERDPSRKPWIMGDYTLLRGEVETRVLEYARASNGVVEACITKPGVIDAPGRTGLVMTGVKTVAHSFIGLPKVEVSEIAATLLDQAVNGIEKDTLLNQDLVRIGHRALADPKNGS